MSLPDRFTDNPGVEIVRGQSLVRYAYLIGETEGVSMREVAFFLGVSPLDLDLQLRGEVGVDPAVALALRHIEEVGLDESWHRCDRILGEEVNRDTRAERLQQLAEAIDLPRGEIAAVIGRTPRWFRLIREGSRSPTPRHVLALCLLRRHSRIQRVILPWLEECFTDPSPGRC